ncbi:MAG: tetratricopeptide repeat protein [Alphaproteobacteria bacterium]|nr:tetratricopeptide repeat protein [Alphaproteobacteria bacterium]
MIRPTVFFSAAIGLLTMVSPARADQSDPRLVPLFQTLQRTSDAQQVQVAVLQIWQIWYETKNQQAAVLLQTGERDVTRGRLDDALAVFDQLVAGAPDFAEGWNRRATALYLLGDYEGSINDCLKVLALEPRHFGALWGLAEMRRVRGEEALALEAYERALAIHPHQDGSRDAVNALRAKLKGRAL